ncbi:hypothetical protein PPL19_09526 [Pseudomonas psychrotolerans L19]|uniref:DUF924 family protein n=1 Tax=Pseudomonas TaxID=286 RepID=UPI00023A4C64|nr:MULTISPECIES: DUF924 family protein [Pseudomonas]EHK71913.1 hypothetical protein PPL19_09526 [Pseudomonas psychrotolerans L19]MBA1183358.1 DUF924 domain-containing protein [Pseudomonas psychrotolerans]MBA1214445.1 DUF924 domain-containing protein [Pseudomonas psychrotolerans]TCQ87044.1 uncharacterized protein (DUF924 family) [Pseudomonas sp. JUb52]
MNPAEIVSFWCAAGRRQWFNGGPGFDAECRARFADTHLAASRGELDGWAASAEGALALCLLLDQIPRNIFRHSGHAFATDGLALKHARQAIDAGLDQQIEAELRAFFYLPFEHSEALADQQRSLELFEALGIEHYRRYAEAHLEVIARYGRFPHRNHALGRHNTLDEQAWLNAGGGF